MESNDQDEITARSPLRGRKSEVDRAATAEEEDLKLEAAAAAAVNSAKWRESLKFPMEIGSSRGTMTVTAWVTRTAPPSGRLVLMRRRPTVSIDMGSGETDVVYVDVKVPTHPWVTSFVVFLYPDGLVEADTLAPGSIEEGPRVSRCRCRGSRSKRASGLCRFLSKEEIAEIMAEVVEDIAVRGLE